MVILYLTCADDDEAKRIANTLLEAKLIACARRSPVSSSYWWDGEINHADEVLLVMESVASKFEEIQAVITKLHSYDGFVLTMTPVEKTTPGVEKWLEESLC